MLTSGGTVVLMRRWDADELLRLVEREKVTLFFAVPTQYQQMYDSPRFRTSNLSSVRFVTSGGAPLPVPLIQAWQAVHAVPFKQGFGMTEFGPGIFSMGPEFAVSKAGSIGRPNYFIDARLVDDDGRDVPEGATGELLLKAPSMCSDGFYFINGRKKDMFISGGENVYPLELETALHEHPAVQACSVVGVPDAKWGEVGRAFVVLKPGASATAEALLEHLRGRVARYKVPKKVELVASLPVSAAGKILKRELRERAIAADRS